LHGLTDSPYSQRHIARFYRDDGFLAIVPRLPAHGTVPAALTDVEWEDWMAATRLAVREARRHTEPSAPLHLVGFSNGGALALMYALDSIGDQLRATSNSSWKVSRAGKSVSDRCKSSNNTMRAASVFNPICAFGVSRIRLAANSQSLHFHPTRCAKIPGPFTNLA
jgi:predicted alpha/beta-fold hydrolase